MTTTKDSACDCVFYRQAPKKHDMLLGIETMTAPWSSKLVADLISDNEMNVGNEPALIDDPNDFTRFVGQHNWKDPVGMYLFAESADFAAEQAWHYRMTTTDRKVCS